ncbi:MAG: hypothetical protein RLY31_783 [Bacteroidota bacterium]
MGVCGKLNAEKMSDKGFLAYWERDAMVGRGPGRLMDNGGKRFESLQ